MYRGNNKGDHDLWRVRNNQLVDISFIGDKRGAGLLASNADMEYLGKHTFRFNPADSKAVKGTMREIEQWEKQHPNDPVNK